MSWYLRPSLGSQLHGALKPQHTHIRWPIATFHRACMHIICLASTVQGPPSASTREQTARNILTIMSGHSLQDKDLEQQLRNSMHALPLAKVDTRIWDRLAANVRRSGPDAVHKALADRLLPVPDVSGAKDQRCQLTSYSVGRRFKEGTQLNRLMADLFVGIAEGTLAKGLPQIELTRWDLFHAHCFFTPRERGLGLLFHAKEYPQQCEAFPYNLGYCQRGSPLEYSEREMDFRNLLYYEGVLCSLDVGQVSVLHNLLIMDGLQDVRTVLETDFGHAICDVNYFGSLDDVPREERLFVCGHYSEEGLEPERS